jgi:3-oxoacyl-[acyl-carrier-protein] synthase II
MSLLSIAGWGVVSPAGLGHDALAAALSRDQPEPRVEAASDVALPAAPAHCYADFDGRTLLGRKGTISRDRVTSLALVAAEAAIESSGLAIDDHNRDRVGVALGTTVGSLKSTMDYSVETLTQEKPYLVNPVLFPNSVMNCAASQIAIRNGLKGVNATIAGGSVAMVQVLRYAANALRRGYADVMLAGAAEEFTPNVAWAAALRDTGRGVGAGEGAAIFAVQRPGDAVGAPAGRHPVHVLAITTGFNADDPAGALADCVRRVLTRAGASTADVVAAAIGSTNDEVEWRALGIALPDGDYERIDLTPKLGDAQAAIGALQFANLVFSHASGRRGTGQVSLLTGCTPEGDVAAVVLGGGEGAGSRRG